MPKIRVLTISKPYVAATYRKKLVDLSRDGRFDIGLICPLQWDNQLFEGHPDPGVATWRLPISFNGKNHFHFYLGLEQAFKEFRPDIVNVEEEHYSIVTAQCFRLAIKYGAKPLFYTWQNIHKKYPPPFSYIEQYIFKHAAAGVCGNADAQSILRSKGYNGPTPAIIQMGVDVSRFKPIAYEDSYKRDLRQRLNLTKESFWASYFGRLVEEKGLMFLIDAVGQLRQQGLDVRCLMAGSGPFEKALRARAQSLHLTDAVIFKSAVPSVEVPAWLQAMDVLCLPSLTRSNWKEQFGRILAEAMVAGTVVVGSNSGEIPKVIGKCGVIVKEGDVAALTGGLRKLMEKPTEWRALQRLAAEEGLLRFSDQVVAKQFGDLFEGLYTPK